VDDLGDLFRGIERNVPEPAWGLPAESALFRPPTSAKAVPFDSDALTVDGGDLFGPRPEPLVGRTPAMEDLSDVFERPPAPEPWVSLAPPEAAAFDEPPEFEEPLASEAPSEQGAPPEPSVLMLAAGLRQLAAELRDLSADPF
jgi:hypothetical protein